MAEPQTLFALSGLVCLGSGLRHWRSLFGAQIHPLMIEMQKGRTIMESAFLVCGAPDTNRTCDPSLRRGMLYPLSYGGKARILAYYVVSNKQP